MARRATRYATFTKGVLDPDLSEREDLEHFYDSLAAGENSVFHPQGGFSDRGGFELCSDAAVLAAGVERRLRRRVMPIPITADNCTASNGGSTLNLVDQSGTTYLVSNAVTATPFVLFQVDFGAELRVDLVDVERFKSELAGADEALAVEWYDGNGWRAFGDAIGVPTRKHIRTTHRTRRFGITPGAAPLTRYLRLVIYGGVGCGQISVGGIRVWRETEALTPVRVRELSRDKAQIYQLVFCERGVDVYEKQRYVASLPLAVAAQQVEELTYVGGFDTKLVFHEQIETARLVRQGGAGEWNVDPAPFVNVPSLTESVLFWGSQDEIQDLELTGVEPGHTLLLFLGDQLAPAIVVGALAGLAAQIRTALIALPGVATATADVQVTQTEATTWRVRFGGANGSRSWPLLSPMVTELPHLVVKTQIVQQGLKADGLMFSALTGWPRSGAFVDQRLLVGGFRGAPTAFRFSRVPALFDFQSTGSPLTADLGFGGALDVDEVETINEIFVGRHPQIFTESGEWWALAVKLDATQPIRFSRASAHGLKRGVPLAFADGATLFMQQGGQTLRDFLYSDVEQSYQAEPLSVLSPQVFTDVVDIAHKPARRVKDGNLVVVANADGKAGVVTLLRRQQVIAGAPWSTWGAGFRSFCATIDHELYAVIERNGDMWLERRVDDRPLDWATRSIGDPRTVIGNAGHLEGRTDVWAIADGELIGPMTVSAGRFTLVEPAADVTFGLMPEWSVRSHVLRDKLVQSQPFKPPTRIYEAEISVESTGGLLLSTCGSPAQEVPMVFSGERNERGGPLQTVNGGRPELPMYERLYTGDITMQGLLGISRHPTWSLSRRLPVPVHIKRVRVEVAERGDSNG